LLLPCDVSKNTVICHQFTIRVCISLCSVCCQDCTCHCYVYEDEQAVKCSFQFWYFCFCYLLKFVSVRQRFRLVKQLI